MYAACRARCPFIVLDGNTHKNRGLFETAGVNIKSLPADASDETIEKAIFEIDYNEYKKLFSWMEEQEPFNIGNLLILK